MLALYSHQGLYKLGVTYQPATVVVEPTTGSEP